MATRPPNERPLKGVRMPVKLPWKGATNNEEQFVSMKKPVADFLGLTKASEAELSYTVQVKKKANADGSGGTGTTGVKRRRRPGFRQRSIKIIFDREKFAKGRSIGDAGSRKSISFPITTSVAMLDVIQFFESGSGKSLGVERVVDVNSGQGYPIVIR